VREEQVKKKFRLFGGDGYRIKPLDIFTLLILVLIIISLCVFGTIFINPNSSINPFRVPSLPTFVALPTSTPTMRSLPATWTPTSWAGGIVSTQPAVAQNTDVISRSLPTPQGGFAYVLEGQPAGVASSLFRTGKACEWMGVGGRVTDMQGVAVKGLIVRVGGTVNGITLDEHITVTGITPSYGVSGYEFSLGNVPLALNNSFWIRLEDVSQQPLSDTFYFNTYADCKRNLILINFKKIR
jgi:hypothetical protein